MTSAAAAVWVPVADMDRAISFYRDVLGLTVTRHQPHWSEVDANGLTIALNARVAPTDPAGRTAVIGYPPDRPLDAEVTRLQGRGVSFSSGISDHAWGRIAPFKDSEGNNLALYARD